ncbi:uncharacterized protein VTP21DRAFT_982 [Calcarisporiella thermophila]|uniref:uncharacterized protein n=1 Tax=Calcarisporiella thermophila TaxID=911321 RepID=UPI003742A828
MSDESEAIPTKGHGGSSALPQNERIPRVEFRRRQKKKRRKEIRRALASMRAKRDIPSNDNNEKEIKEYEEAKRKWELSEQKIIAENRVRLRAEEVRKKIEEELKPKLEEDMLNKSKEQEKHVTDWTTAYLHPHSTMEARTPVMYSALPDPETVSEKDPNYCFLYLRTGVCPNGKHCTKLHPYPYHSSTIMVKNMYDGIRKILSDEDTDIMLEYSDEEIAEHFAEWFDDVYAEFNHFGRVIEFKVARNNASHLRGNVYVQYAREADASAAFKIMHGRFYAGKRLQCQFVPVTKWHLALCADYEKGECLRGDECNFLHPYPTPSSFHLLRREGFAPGDKDEHAFSSHRREDEAHCARLEHGTRDGLAPPSATKQDSPVYIPQSPTLPPGQGHSL